MCLCMQKANRQRISLNRNFKSDSVGMMVSYVLLLHSITDFRCFRYVFMCMGKQNKNKQTLDCNNLHVGGTKRIEYSYEYGTRYTNYPILSYLRLVFPHKLLYICRMHIHSHTDTRHEQPSPEKFICSESSVRKRIHVHAKCPTLRAHTRCVAPMELPSFGCLLDASIALATGQDRTTYSNSRSNTSIHAPNYTQLSIHGIWSAQFTAKLLRDNFHFLLSPILNCIIPNLRQSSENGWEIEIHFGFCIRFLHHSPGGTAETEALGNESSCTVTVSIHIGVSCNINCSIRSVCDGVWVFLLVKHWMNSS